MTPDEINKIINDIKVIYPDWYWTHNISLLEYNDLYLYIRWMVGEEENRPKLLHLDKEKLNAVRQSLNRFLSDQYD